MLFIDASKEFKPGKNQNTLEDEHIQKIVDAYVKREDVDKFAHVADMAEIEANGWNLNIPRYVDTFEEEKPVDLEVVRDDLKRIESEKKAAIDRAESMLRQLGVWTVAKKQKTDLGKRAIYNYHVRNDGNNARVPPAVVDCWYPTSPKQEEILILSKMRNLTKGRDGVQVRISEANLPSLFMTGGYTKTADGMYIYEQGVVMQRTRSRFHDFAGRGLLEGVIGAPAITFSGLRQLEDLVAFDDSADDVIREFVAAVRENTSAMQSHDQKLIGLLEGLESQISVAEKKKGDVVTMAANVATIIGTVPTVANAVPGVMNVIHRLFEFIGR